MLYFKSKKIKIYIKTKKAIKDCLIFEAVFYLKVNNYTTLINTRVCDKINLTKYIGGMIPNEKKSFD